MYSTVMYDHCKVCSAIKCKPAVMYDQCKVCSAIMCDRYKI